MTAFATVFTAQLVHSHALQGPQHYLELLQVSGVIGPCALALYALNYSRIDFLTALTALFGYNLSEQLPVRSFTHVISLMQARTKLVNLDIVKMPSIQTLLNLDVLYCRHAVPYDCMFPDKLRDCKLNGRSNMRLTHICMPRGRRLTACKTALCKCAFGKATQQPPSFGCEALAPCTQVSHNCVALHVPAAQLYHAVFSPLSQKT